MNLQKGNRELEAYKAKVTVRGNHTQIKMYPVKPSAFDQLSTLKKSSSCSSYDHANFNHPRHALMFEMEDSFITFAELIKPARRNIESLIIIIKKFPS